ncbi:hypothetical protein DFH08DRAFT_654529, partial [Mycena albidolilacea]
IIFAGDFAQLPPVGMKSLYANIETSKESASGKKGQQNILGKLLWLSIKTVVTLTRVERVQRRMNDITDADFDLLNSRFVTRLRPRLRDVPVIVSQNELKDALNQRAARAYAEHTGNHLDWY